MAFQGFEANRGVCGTLKYRCPAAAFGFECAGRDACHRAGGVEPGEYGRIVRIGLDSHDRRIFTPTPWGSPSWRRGYRRRSAMERINSRIDQGFGFETHLHPRPCQDEGPYRAGAGGDDGESADSARPAGSGRRYPPAPDWQRAPEKRHSAHASSWPITGKPLDTNQDEPEPPLNNRLRCPIHSDGHASRA